MFPLALLVLSSRKLYIAIVYKDLQSSGRFSLVRLEECGGCQKWVERAAEAEAKSLAEMLQTRVFGQQQVL